MRPSSLIASSKRAFSASRSPAPGRGVAEVQQRQRPRGCEFEIGRRLDLPGQPFGERDMAAHHRPQRLQTVGAQHEPQFQGAEAPPQGDAPVAVIDNLARLATLQKGGKDRQRARQRRRIAHEMRRTVEIRQQPFMRVEDETVYGVRSRRSYPGALRRGARPPPRPRRRGRTTRARRRPRRISASGFDGADPGRAEAGDDAGRPPARPLVGANRSREPRRLHGEGRVGFDMADVLAPVTGDLCAFLDRRMRLIGDVDG